MRLLDRYHRLAHVTEGAIFRNRSGEPLSSAGAYLMVRRRGQQVGIEGLHPHAFRHLCATRLLGEGLNESHIRTLLGWSKSSQMLSRYVASRSAELALEARSRVRLIE